MVEQGANVNAKDKGGWTALAFASINMEDIQMVRLLLANGADPNIDLGYGLRPLCLVKVKARNQAMLQIAFLLKRAGAKE